MERFWGNPKTQGKCMQALGHWLGVHRRHMRSMPIKRWGSQHVLARNATLPAGNGSFCKKPHKACPWAPETIKKRIKGRQMSNHRWFDICRRALLHPTLMCLDPRKILRTSCQLHFWFDQTRKNPQCKSAPPPNVFGGQKSPPHAHTHAKWLSSPTNGLVEFYRFSTL